MTTDWLVLRILDLGISKLTYGVFILKLILSYLPVHLISPSLYLPDTQIKHFFPLSQWEIPLLPVTYVWHQYQAVWPPPTPARQSSMAGECGEDGREHIRWTGKYDNISFRIKTPHWNT